MNIRHITREEVYSHLDTPYNPPTSTADDEAACQTFYDEWYEVRAGLLKVLEHFGEHDDYDDKDFNLGDVVMLSRGIGVTFTRKTMFQSKVLEAVAAYLAALPNDYEVNVTLQEDGQSHHAIFISRTQVLAELPERLWRELIPAAWL